MTQTSFEPITEDGVTFLSEQDLAMYRQYKLCDEAYQFLQTSLGQHLFRSCAERMDKAAQALIKVDPSDTSAVVRLQIEAAVARSIPEFLNRVIQEGELAGQVLNEGAEE